MNKLFRSCLSAFAVLLLAYLPAGAVGFDLEVGITTTNPNPAIYSNVPITVTATNTGTTTGTGIEIRLLQCGGNIGSFVQGTGLVYASTGTASLGTWDFVSQRWTIPSLAAGQTATLNFTLFVLTTDPRSVNVFSQTATTPDVDSSPGNLPIANGNWVCTDNEDDEALLTLNDVTGPEPDMNLSSFLAVQNNGQAGSSVITPGAQVAAGTPISFVDHLAYLTFPQPVPSFNSVIAAYLSTDATLSANDVLITSTALTINANVQSYGFTEGPFGNGTIASNTTPGSYFIIVKYDATDLLAETDEANNFKTLPIVVTGGTNLPDLSGILHEFIPGNVCYTAPGQPFGFISMQINNMGTAVATAFKVKFYFSTDNVLSANDVLWVTENLPSLGLFSNGGPAFVSPTQPVPASLPMGQYYIITTIDGENQVAESNETNNTITPFTVQIGAADVTMQGVAGVPASAPAGSSFTVQVTAKYVSNGFSFPAGTGFPVDVVVTDISPFQTIGTVNFNLSEFASSNTVTKSVQVNVPATLAVGTHNFRFAANPAFCEPKGSSNWQDKSITVTLGTGSGIDLELSMVQNTANPVIYSNYTTTLTLVNKGPQAATGVKVKWAKPAGVVYTGGNEFTASQGSFNPNGDQVWTVGSVPANGSATLTVRYFLLQNGAPITYAQVTAANETDVDSQPNNGTPPTPVQDDEANSGGSQPPVLTPDLTISNLVFANGPGTPGQVLAYYFDLSNIGNGNAPQDFIVRAWISTSPTFNTTGIQDGIVPTGNFIAGFSVTEVPGASTLPSTLPAGQYYLHLWVDADGQVTETNENNNTVSVPFLVQAAAGPGVCDDLIGGGTIQCVWQNSSGLAQVYYNAPNGYRVAILDGAGQVATDQSAGTAPAYPVFRIANGNFEKLENNAVVFSVPIPTALSSQYSGFFSFTSFNDGYIIFAYKNDNYGLYTIRTDANFVAQQTVLRGTYSYSGMHIVSVAYQVSPNRLAFLEYYNAGGTVSDLKMMDGGTLTDVYSTNLHSPNYYGAGASLYPTGCGNFTVKVSLAYDCHRGSCYSMYYREGYFTDTEFKTVHTYSTGLQSSMGFGTGYHTWELKNPDGSTITASYNVPMINGLSIYTNVVRVEKMQGSTSVWTKYVKLSNAASVRRIALSGNELVFLSEKNNAVFVEAMNCVEPTTPHADLSNIVASGSYPTSLQAGDTGNFYPHLLNLGTAPATNFDLKLVLSADNVYSPSADILLGSVSVLSLAPGFSSQQTISYTVPTTIASGTYQFMLVADAGNAVVESNENNNVFMTPVTVTGGGTGQTGCNAITITPGTNSLTIAGASAPHVLIKVFNPNWTLNFQCLDNCANPLTLNNLSAGVYHLQIKLLDNGWGEICYLELDVMVNSFGGGNGTSIARLDERLRLNLDRFYPSPTSYQVTVDVFSPIAQAATLDFYDQMGRPVHNMKVQLDKGNNPIQVLVYDWKSGAYNVIARGEETGLPAYGRFLKVWEE